MASRAPVSRPTGAGRCHSNSSAVVNTPRTPSGKALGRVECPRRGQGLPRASAVAIPTVLPSFNTFALPRRRRRSIRRSVCRRSYHNDRERGRARPRHGNRRRRRPASAPPADPLLPSSTPPGARPFGRSSSDHRRGSRRPDAGREGRRASAPVFRGHRARSRPSATSPSYAATSEPSSSRSMRSVSAARSRLCVTTTNAIPRSRASSKSSAWSRSLFA